ncbi:uncharacterized protein BDR25DRAFT_355052 [Lindgomyces ingoldianus]|uniref:Uncharacterized protein n=1 Tax=Lindgomyces ingoldianus TaxID=673940 RepID=A0ACB6QU84_9PLEO|nr:uncharacterized protein BDR25DRAFT_355052 [Lindgomyces ingoldianus]KAF2470564.1 hypothetical protein BDR25DRAFT_355052 [Lindgomyces ingoldianus]
MIATNILTGSHKFRHPSYCLAILSLHHCSLTTNPLPGGSSSDILYNICKSLAFEICQGVKWYRASTRVGWKARRVCGRSSIQKYGAERMLTAVLYLKVFISINAVYDGRILCQRIVNIVNPGISNKSSGAALLEYEFTSTRLLERRQVVPEPECLEVDSRDMKRATSAGIFDQLNAAPRGRRVGYCYVSSCENVEPSKVGHHKENNERVPNPLDRYYLSPLGERSPSWVSNNHVKPCLSKQINFMSLKQVRTKTPQPMHNKSIRKYSEAEKGRTDVDEVDPTDDREPRKLDASNRPTHLSCFGTSKDPKFPERPPSRRKLYKSCTPVGMLEGVGWITAGAHASEWVRGLALATVHYIPCRPPPPPIPLTPHSSLFTLISELHTTIANHPETKSKHHWYKFGHLLDHFYCLYDIPPLQLLMRPPFLPTTMSESDSIRLRSGAQYRKAEFVDGKVVRIQEHRRRAEVFDLAGPSTSNRRDQFGRALNDRMKSKGFPMEDQNTPGPNLRELNTTRHVTGLGHPSKGSKAKAVIFQKTKPAKTTEEQGLKSHEISTLLTPPPTPKIKRLPTPELPDLDGSPFCDCCIEAHVIKYCTSHDSAYSLYFFDLYEKWRSLRISYFQIFPYLGSGNSQNDLGGTVLCGATIWCYFQVDIEPRPIMTFVFY